MPDLLTGIVAVALVFGMVCAAIHVLIDKDDEPPHASL